MARSCSCPAPSGAGPIRDSGIPSGPSFMSSNAACADTPHLDGRLGLRRWSEWWSEVGNQRGARFRSDIARRHPRCDREVNPGRRGREGRDPGSCVRCGLALLHRARCAASARREAHMARHRLGRPPRGRRLRQAFAPSRDDGNGLHVVNIPRSPRAGRAPAAGRSALRPQSMPT